MSWLLMRPGLLVVLAATLLACVWIAGQEEDEAVQAVPLVRGETNESPLRGRDNAIDGDADVGAELDLDRLRRRQFAGTDVDPFRALRWFVPPPLIVQAPLPPPKPTAPPLPFQFVGRIEEVGSDRPVFHLSDGNALYTVAVGELFAAVYRLEQVEREGLRIRYLPLSILQTLPLGASE